VKSTNTTIQLNSFNIKKHSELDPDISFTIDSDSTLGEVFESFQAFLVAVGYRFPDGAVLGYDYDHQGK
jgi:hypothetical protein